MSGIVAGPISTYSAITEAPILPAGHSLWGILERLEPVGDGLLRVQVSAREYLVDESLQATLAGLLGEQVSICRIAGRWGVGRLGLSLSKWEQFEMLGRLA